MYTPDSVRTIRRALALLDGPARRGWAGLVLLAVVAAGAEALGTAALLGAIEQLRGARTLIVIAHRLSSVRPCDRLMLLADGRAAAVGRYDELLRDSTDFRGSRLGGMSPTCRAS